MTPDALGFWQSALWAGASWTWAWIFVPFPCRPPTILTIGAALPPPSSQPCCLCVWDRLPCPWAEPSFRLAPAGGQTERALPLHPT